MIIDVHCHAGKGDGLTGPWDTDASLDDYLPRARAAGITHSVLFSPFCSDYARANAEVRAIVDDDRSRFFGFCFVHPARDKGRVGEMVRRAVEEYGFVGIKVHRHDAPITREVCEAARRYRLPILYDVTGDVSKVELLATEYPEVAFVVPHLGSFSDDWKAQVFLIDMLERHSNVHTDSAGVRRFDLLVQAVRRAGAHKLLFGSDGPWLHPGVELEKIRALGLSREDERLVLSGNFLRLTEAPRRRLRDHPKGRIGLHSAVRREARRS